MAYTHYNINITSSVDMEPIVGRVNITRHQYNLYKINII